MILIVNRRNNVHDIVSFCSEEFKFSSPFAHGIMLWFEKKIYMKRQYSKKLKEKYLIKEWIKSNYCGFGRIYLNIYVV